MDGVCANDVQASQVELTAYIDQFADAIVDVNAIVNGSVLTLADFR